MKLLHDSGPDNPPAMLKAADCPVIGYMRADGELVAVRETVLYDRNTQILHTRQL